MSQYNVLKAEIDANIKQNGVQAITGTILNSVINAMVNTLGAEYQFAGVATIDTNPGTPDAKVFYIANGKGIYTNFGGINVTENEVVILYYDTIWHKDVTGIASNEKLTELEEGIDDVIIGEDAYNAEFNIVGYIQPEDGEILAVPGGKSTDFIHIKKNSNLRYKLCYSSSANIISFYDRNKQYLKELSISPTSYGTFEGEIDFSDTKYKEAYHVRFSNYTDGNPNPIALFTYFSLSEIKKSTENGEKEIGNIKKEVDNIISSKEINIQFSQNGYINYSDGSFESTGNTNKCSDYIEVGVSNVINYNLTHTTSVALVAFYDKNKNYLANLGIRGSESFTAKMGSIYLSEDNYSDVKYVRLCSYVDQIPRWGASLNNTSLMTISKRVDGLGSLINTSSKTIGDDVMNIVGYIQSDGTHIGMPNARCSDFIEIGCHNKLIDFDLTFNTNSYIIAFYDSFYNFLEEISILGAVSFGSKKGVINIADEKYKDASFVRFSNYTDSEPVWHIIIRDLGVGELYNNSKIPSPNETWNLKNEADSVLKSIYGRNYVNLIGQANDRYDFGGVKVAQDFTVPNIGEEVNIIVSSNPTYTYQVERNFWNVNDAICVGSKDVYDIYQITSVNDMVITCKLLKCNTNMIGNTVIASFAHTNENPDYGHQVSYDNVRVYKYEDILAYESNETPITFCLDAIHPTAENSVLLGKILASNMLAQFHNVNKVISFGDSWTKFAHGWADGIHEILPTCEVVDQGVPSDRIEHIVDRFRTYISSYTYNEGDVFVFVIGTNNLIQNARRGIVQGVDYSDPNMRLWNKSYISLMRKACSVISELLPRGNWIVANGHNDSFSYKEYREF